MRSSMLAFCLLFFVACGTYDDNGGYGENPTPPTESEKFVAIKVTLKDECARCHNGTVHPLDFNNENVWARSNSKNRISNNTMPPDKRLSVDKKQNLLSYFL